MVDYGKIIESLLCVAHNFDDDFADAFRNRRQFHH
jgi:hypothetical protein